MLLLVLSIFTSLLAALAAMLWFLMFRKHWGRFLSAPIAAAAIIHLLPEISQFFSIALFFVALAITTLADKQSFWQYLMTPKEVEAEFSGASRVKKSNSLGSYVFSYKDAEGSITRRQVDVDKVWTENSKTYFSGFCHRANDERNFRLDRVFGEVIDLDTGEVVNIDA